MAKLIPGVNDAATTDYERSKLMFVDFKVAKTVTRSSGKKAWFRCPDDARHPNWEAAVYSVIASSASCAACSGRRVIAGVNDAPTTDPERSKMFVDQEFAKTVTRSSGKRAMFRCPNDARHPNWDAPVCDVIATGSDCGVCACRRLVAGVNDVATTDYERSKLMFVDFEVAKTVTRGSNKRAMFRCPNDERHPNWSATVCDVIADGTGCGVCAGKRVVAGVNDAATTDPERSKMFADPEVARTVTRSSHKKAMFRCLNDARHRWSAHVSSVIANGRGCSICHGLTVIAGANDAPTTDPERSKMFVDQEFAKTVTRSSNKKAWFRCLASTAHPAWEANVFEVVSRGTGCPSCANYGYDPSKPGTLYVLDATTHIVFGITGNLEQRLKSYDDSRVLLHRFDFEDGGEARRIESAIKRQFKDCRYDESDLPGEVFESLTLDCLADLLDFLA